MIRACLKSFDKPHILWLGRMNTIKMNFLPKLLYTFQAVPAPPSPVFFLISK